MAEVDWEHKKWSSFEQRCLDRETAKSDFDERCEYRENRYDFRSSYMQYLDEQLEKLRQTRSQCRAGFHSGRVDDGALTTGRTGNLEEELVKLKDCRNRVVEQRDNFYLTAELAKPPEKRNRKIFKFNNLTYLNKVAEKGKLTQLKNELEALDEECRQLKLAYKIQNEDHQFRYLMLKDGLNYLHDAKAER